MKQDKALKDKFLEVLSSRPDASMLVKKLQNSGEVLMFGGCVREYYDSEYKNLPRDFDLVIQSEYCLESTLSECNVDFIKNRFGGYKIFIDDLYFDLWEIRETWAIKNKKIEFKQFEDLVKTVFLNIDAIIFNLNTAEIYDEGYMQAIKHHELDIVLEDNPHPELNVARAFRLKNYYNLNFSTEFNRYVLAWLESHNNYEEAISILKNIELNRYKSEQINWIREMKELQPG